MKLLFDTRESWGMAFLRVILGVVFFAHGAQKVLGIFGGPGLSGAIAALHGQLGLPLLLALTVIALEFLGGIALIAGFLTRLIALGLGIEMIVAVALIHHNYGFFMNWWGTQKGEGFEYHLLVIGMCLALLFEGAGAISLDRTIAERLASA